MKDKYLSHHLLGILFTGLFAANAVCMLISGFGLAVVFPRWLIFWISLFSILMPVLLYFRFGWCAILLLSVCGGTALWQKGELWNQIQSLVYAVSSHYSNVYNWPDFGAPLSETYDLALILLAYLTAVCVSFSICKDGDVTVPLAAAILPLALCLVTTDTLPAEPFLFSGMLGIILLLLTDWARLHNPGRYGSAFLKMSVPAALAIAVLFYFNPQDGYVNRAAELQKNAVKWFQQIKNTAESVVSGNITGNSGAQTLNLRNVGPKSEFSYTVMRITSTHGGTLYLRGRDYDIYTGTEWESSEGRGETFPKGVMTTESVSIVTYGVRDFLYLPYYPTESAALFDGYLDNSENKNVYSCVFSRSPGTVPAPGSSLTDLPEETKVWAKEWLKPILNGRTNREAVVRLIGDYVRSRASYDLSTSSMSDEYTDFARWFLEESDTGYCVHFATAAAVLLRAAGIPARYVEGYTVTCEADEKTLVSNQEAHAWVEYYSEQSDTWLILEATPAAVREEPEPAETDPAETEPEESEAEETLPEETGSAAPEPDASESTEGNNPSHSGSSGVGNGSGSGTGSQSGNGAQNGTGSGGGSSVGNQTLTPKEPFRLPEWVKKAAWILLGFSLIPLQGNLRILYRRKRWFSGEPNRMAVYRWKRCRRLAKLTKTELPVELDELARKAAFSQHTLTREEMYRFELFRQKVLVDVHVMPWYRKYFLRWILAVG